MTFGHAVVAGKVLQEWDPLGIHFAIGQLWNPSDLPRQFVFSLVTLLPPTRASLEVGRVAPAAILIVVYPCIVQGNEPSVSSPPISGSDLSSVVLSHGGYIFARLSIVITDSTLRYASFIKRIY